MINAKEIREFIVSVRDTNLVLLSTPIPLYFFRATNDGDDLSTFGYRYDLYLMDGSVVDITHASIDIHPLILEGPDPVRRNIFINVPGGGIVSVHPKDVSHHNGWLTKKLRQHGLKWHDVDWGIIGTNH